MGPTLRCALAAGPALREARDAQRQGNMNIEWKKEGDDGREGARVLPNPCGLLLEVCPLLGGDVEWIVWATTPDNCDEVAKGVADDVPLAKRAAEEYADDILRLQDKAIYDAFGGRP